MDEGFLSNLRWYTVKCLSTKKSTKTGPPQKTPSIFSFAVLLRGVTFVCNRFFCRVCLHLVPFVSFVCTPSAVAFVCSRSTVTFVCTRFCCRVCLHLVLFVAFVCPLFPVCSLRSTFTKINLVTFVCTWSHLSRLFAPGFRKILSRLLAPTGCKQTRHTV